MLNDNGSRCNGQILSLGWLLSFWWTSNIIQKKSLNVFPFLCPLWSSKYWTTSSQIFLFPKSLFSSFSLSVSKSSTFLFLSTCLCSVSVSIREAEDDEGAKNNRALLGALFSYLWTTEVSRTFNSQSLDMGDFMCSVHASLAAAKRATVPTQAGKSKRRDSNQVKFCFLWEDIGWCEGSVQNQVPQLL